MDVLGVLERRSLRKLRVVPRWPLWSLSRPVLIFLVAIELGALAAVVVAAIHTQIVFRDVLVFFELLACSVALIEVRRRVAVPQPGKAVVKDMISIWLLPIALLLPPLYGLLVAIPLLALTHWRVHTGVAYRRVFTAAAIMLALGAAGQVFHALIKRPVWLTGSDNTLLLAVLAVLAAAVIRWVVNAGLVSIAVKITVPGLRWRSLIFNRDNAISDVVEICFGTLSTVLVAVNPLLVLITIPPVLLSQRAVQYAQLVAAVRSDAKTGLLNATTWEQEADEAILRGSRTGKPLAVLLLDIDHFKRVNDTLGHLAGDQVLRAIANALPTQLRQSDVIGRFGGEEFAVLLPNTDTREAVRIAERLRRRIAQLIVPLNGDHGLTTAATVRVTVSIGVAMRGGRGSSSTADLLAIADRALYRAKGQGRDQVCLEAYGESLKAA